MAPNIGTPIVSLVCRLAALLVALAGCSAGGRPEVDPNAYPTTYKEDVFVYLQNHASEMENVREAYLSTPALTQFGGSQSRYFVCLRTEGQGWRKEKMVVFFSGQINQYVDASSQQCGVAAYQPFPEVTALVSGLGRKK
jgi:hypothetical protein